jgi:8-oxo-dGTP pyrophosphatase MutT (NUDIX family)
MRFVDAVERLRTLPAVLPASPEVLIPVLVESGDRRPVPSLDPELVRPAAVLVLVVPDAEGEARVVLIERATYDGHHSGEVAFPGGSQDPADDDPVATALREATEEVGLDVGACGLRVVGLLDLFWIPVSGFRVTPVLAVAERRPRLTPDPHEVARVIEAPLAAFLPGAEIRIVERTIRDWPIRFGAYPVGDLLVWGATARILGQLAALLADRAGPRPETGG